LPAATGAATAEGAAAKATETTAEAAATEASIVSSGSDYRTGIDGPASSRSATA